MAQLTFANKLYEQEDYLIAFTPLTESETSEHLVFLVNKALKEFMIPKEKVLSLATDGASNMRRAVKNLGIPWISCAAHVTNLASKTALVKCDAASSVVDMSHAIVAAIHGSNALTQSLAADLRSRGSSLKSVITPVKTRWDSDFECMERIGEINKSLEVVLDRTRSDTLVGSRSLLCQIVELFRFMKQTTEHFTHYSSDGVAPSVITMLPKALETIVQVLEFTVDRMWEWFTAFRSREDSFDGFLSVTYDIREKPRTGNTLYLAFTAGLTLAQAAHYHFFGKIHPTMHDALPPLWIECVGLNFSMTQWSDALEKLKDILKRPLPPLASLYSPDKFEFETFLGSTDIIDDALLESEENATWASYPWEAYLNDTPAPLTLPDGLARVKKLAQRLYLDCTWIASQRSHHTEAFLDVLKSANVFIAPCESAPLPDSSSSAVHPSLMLPRHHVSPILNPTREEICYTIQHWCNTDPLFLRQRLATTDRRAHAAKLLEKILSGINPTSVAVERCFSDATILNTPERASLSNDNFGAEVFIRHNAKKLLKGDIEEGMMWKKRSKQLENKDSNKAHRIRTHSSHTTPYATPKPLSMENPSSPCTPTVPNTPADISRELSFSSFSDLSEQATPIILIEELYPDGISLEGSDPLPKDKLRKRSRADAFATERSNIAVECFQTSLVENNEINHSEAPTLPGTRRSLRAIESRRNGPLQPNEYVNCRGPRREILCEARSNSISFLKDGLSFNAFYLKAFEDKSMEEAQSVFAFYVSASVNHLASDFWACFERCIAVEDQSPMKTLTEWHNSSMLEIHSEIPTRKDQDTTSASIDWNLSSSTLLPLEDVITHTPWPNNKPQIKRLADRYNLAYKPAQGDGNCFFHAVLNCVEALRNLRRFEAEWMPSKTQKVALAKAASLREAVIQFIRDNFDKNDERLVIDDKKVSITVWCSHFGRDGEWADGLLATATAQFLNLNMTILRLGGPPTIVTFDGAIRRFFLLWTFQTHYDSLIHRATAPTRALAMIFDEKR